MARRKGPTEKALVRRLRRHLTDAGCQVIKTTGVSLVGTPDLIGCYQGRSFVLECKARGGKVTPKQLHELKRWREAGSVAIVAWPDFDVADFLAALGGQ